MNERNVKGETTHWHPHELYVYAPCMTYTWPLTNPRNQQIIVTLSYKTTMQRQTAVTGNIKSVFMFVTTLWHKIKNTDVDLPQIYREVSNMMITF